MIPPLPTPDESQRLAALRNYAILDTLPDQTLDDLTALAAQICTVPIALVSLVDEHRQWFKSKVGMDATETPREISFSGHAIQHRDLFIVPDATQDERFADNPLVVGETGLRFYAGAPIVTSDGFALGALCIMDRVPRTLTDLQQQALRVLARQVLTHLELQRHTRKLFESEQRLHIATENAHVGLVLIDRHRRYVYANKAYARMLGLPLSEILDRPLSEVLSTVYEGQVGPNLDRAFAGERVAYELCKPGPHGQRYYDVRYENSQVDGVVVMVVAVITDITESKLTEQASRRLSAIVEFSDDAIIGKNLDSIITSWNKGAQKIFGYTAEEMVGASILRLIPEDRHDEENMILGKIKNGESVEHFETLRRTKDGRLIDISVTASPIKNSAGRVTGVSKVARDISERKRAEQQLKLLNTSISNLNDIVLITEAGPLDEPGPKIVFVNEAFERITGYPRAEAIGRSPRFLQGEKTDPKVLREIREALARRQPIRRQIVNYAKNGTAYWLDIDIVPIFDAAGQCTHFAAIERDITEAKIAEESLKLFRTLIDRSNDGIEVIDARTGRYLDVNETSCRRLGYTRDEMLRLTIADVIAQNESPFSVSEEMAKTKMESSRIVERLLRRKNGATFPVEINVQYIDLDRGYIVAIVRDIAERKKADEQIAEQAALLDKAQDAIVELDLEKKVLFWNKGAERIYGWTRGEVIGRDVSEFFYAHYEKFEEITRLTFEQGDWSGEIAQLNKDRREIVVQSSRTLIRDDRGRPKSVLVINTDITERKKLEAQFMRAQRMESIGTLAGGIAHDLNNILAPILMSIEILKTLVDGPPVNKILDTIEVSAKRGADIVRQVLSFARGLEGQRVEIQPNHLLKDLGSIVKDTFPKDIRLHFSVPGDTWTILGDPTQVHQILLNLCVNARDAMPNGGNLTVSMENCVLDEQYSAMNLQARPGRYVAITVADSGTGIPPEIVHKIFEPFFTTKELNKGTGLGLSTVMAIVKSHQGIVNVYSEPGQGTTFKVYLPAVEISSAAAGPHEDEAALPRGNGETVLIVDDEPSILTITSQTLQAFGYRVLTAADGADAVAMYAQHRHEIAVVLTDMMMPVMDGSATIYALLRIDPTLKIIAASGLDANGGVARASGAGIEHFLAKPYTAKALLKTLRAILAKP